ncbi:hypothetical protein CAOG_010157 [Capsaspora owczarzaki ATCC 30864]|uniref:Uncharacterized protein n=1 Tax=Capsaspora owczarzaki (strain ATCC 30864) TaxID=595528 RepID=A0A0D2W0N9_CAPO3|nr:hypothetical protein CAOG_010157 [Capsaspora owczarzaki ATCC 30864]
MTCASLAFSSAVCEQQCTARVDRTSSSFAFVAFVVVVCRHANDMRQPDYNFQIHFFFKNQSSQWRCEKKQRFGSPTNGAQLSKLGKYEHSRTPGHASVVTESLQLTSCPFSYRFTDST